MHMYAERIREAVPLELIHVAEVTAREVAANRMSSVALLGTRYVMEGDFYLSKLQGAGLRALTPGEADRAYIHRAIFEELTKSKFLPKTKERFIEIIAELKEQGAEGVILGCTEIPLLIKQEESPLQLFDTTKFHAAAAESRALDG